MGIVLPLVVVFIACLIIWKTSDSFERASEYLGRNLSDGVRGATINAIASSMPELLTSLFFLINIKNAEGLSGGIGTTTGSAIYNSMVIPALVGIFVFFKLSSKKFKLTRKVILRDGFFLLIIEVIFLFILSGKNITWFDGFLLVLAYFIYLAFMFITMKNRAPQAEETAGTSNKDVSPDYEQKNKFISLLKLNLTYVVIGNKKITSNKAWILLSFSTFIMGLSCLLLVQACEYLGSESYYLPLFGELKGLDIPIMFVALILVSAASSVPDTIISIKDAQNGNYDDAFSNVLGSNIFDICFALGLPILIYTIIYGPFVMPESIIEITFELRIILIVLTLAALFIFLVGNHFTRIKAVLLMVIYCIFVTYVVLRGFDIEIPFEKVLLNIF
jgi:Ca2+/Na+ antiporter